ncbi:MAG: Mov34/MPN/PAD-1 family protein [Myxococcota bacterium]|nr:Mov34/MPN/PAD-1 family protein [Myxococcota bacterium]
MLHTHLDGASDDVSSLNARDLMSQAAIRSALEAHAMAWFPKEACALLVVDAQGPRAILADNEQDRLHQRDPVAFPRNAETAYSLNPLLIQQTQDAGGTVVAIVHSHCRVGAYFSDKDQADAQCPFSDEPAPLHPGVEYVVLDAQDDGVRGYEIFAWSGDEGAYVA